MMTKSMKGIAPRAFPQYTFPKHVEMLLTSRGSVWQDNSSHNDCCPSVVNLDLGVCLWVNVPKEDRKDDSEKVDYWVNGLIYTGEFEQPWEVDHSEVLYMGDSWSHVLETLATRKRED